MPTAASKKNKVFTVKVKNAGPSDSDGYTLIDNVPACTSFVSALGCTHASVSVIRRPPAISTLFPYTTLFRSHIDPSFADGGTLSNTASLTAESTSDPDLTNNSATST